MSSGSDSEESMDPQANDRVTNRQLRAICLRLAENHHTLESHGRTLEAHGRLIRAATAQVETLTTEVRVLQQRAETIDALPSDVHSLMARVSALESIAGGTELAAPTAAAAAMPSARVSPTDPAMRKKPPPNAEPAKKKRRKKACGVCGWSIDDRTNDGDFQVDWFTWHPRGVGNQHAECFCPEDKRHAKKRASLG